MKKKYLWLIFILILSSAVLLVSLQSKQTTAEKNYIKSTYLPIYKPWDTSMIQGDLLTHINLAFATLNPDFTASLHPVPSLDLKSEIEELKMLYPHLIINLGIGGWGVDGFSDLASSASSRKVFIDSMLVLLQEYNLDGIDIDWEFPGQDAGGTITCHAQDPQNFVLLIQELRQALDSLTQQTGKHYELSFAAPLDSWALESLNIAEVIDYVDHINLMAYDYIGAWSKTTGHHSNWVTHEASPVPGNTYDGLLNYLTICPPEKLILGLPAYGYSWSGVPPTQNGLFQSSESALSPHQADLSYTAITSHYNESTGYQSYWDDMAKASYLYNGDTWITYDDPTSIAYKADFVKSLGLGGMMYWEYTQDSTGEFLSAIYNSLK